MDAEDTARTLTVGDLLDALADYPRELKIAAESMDSCVTDAVGVLTYQESAESTLKRFVIRVSYDEPSTLFWYCSDNPNGR